MAEPTQADKDAVAALFVRGWLFTEDAEQLDSVPRAQDSHLTRRHIVEQIVAEAHAEERAAEARRYLHFFGEPLSNAAGGTNCPVCEEALPGHIEGCPWPEWHARVEALVGDTDG